MNNDMTDAIRKAMERIEHLGEEKLKKVEKALEKLEANFSGLNVFTEDVPEQKNESAKKDPEGHQESDGEFAGSNSAYQGVIQNTGVLDFTSMHSAEELSKITGFKNVGVILIPESLQGALSAIPMKNVGQILPVPAGATVRIQSGQLELDGEAFVNPGGDENEMLLLLGQILITSPVEKVGFSSLIIAGQLIAPRASQAVLNAAITKMMGQAIYYKGEEPKLFMGKETILKEYLEFLEKKISLIVIGKVDFDDAITPTLLKEKVEEVVLLGKMRAQKELVPLLQVLTTKKLGVISEK